MAIRQGKATRRPGKVLAPVRPNAAIEARQKARLDKLLDAMHRSVVRQVCAAYRAKPPELAQDASPASVLGEVFRRIARQWLKRFDDLAPALARHFASGAKQNADASLRHILRKGGMSVEFRTSRAVNDVVQASIAENVSLIKSIASQYLTQVEGDVMRSVQTGRDLAQLSKDLRERYGVAKRRAAFIARDQNNKMTAVITRARQLESGITQAIWVHSTAGRKPRPSHLKAGRDRLRYDVQKGAYLDGEWIFPGQLPNCRCVSRPVLEGFE